MVLDNEAIYEICQKHLDVKRPSYDNLNRLITKTISSMTASLRFDGELNVDLNEFQTNLVPFPRLHFMITAMAPILTPAKMVQHSKNDVRGITESCFSASNFFTKFCVFSFCFVVLHMRSHTVKYQELLISSRKTINIWRFR